MYLENIFIGGDICSQLPKEAKMFDDIDKMFKEVSCPILPFHYKCKYTFLLELLKKSSLFSDNEHHYKRSKY